MNIEEMALNELKALQEQIRLQIYRLEEADNQAVALLRKGHVIREHEDEIVFPDSRLITYNVWWEIDGTVIDEDDTLYRHCDNLHKCVQAGMVEARPVNDKRYDSVTEYVVRAK